jgi:hypothetical protein
LLVACGAPDEDAGAELGAKEEAAPEREVELDAGDLMAVNQARIDQLVADALERSADGAPPESSSHADTAAAKQGKDADFRERRGTRLSAEEQARARDIAEALGIGAERVSFLGQLVFVDGDTQLELDLPAAPRGSEAREAPAVEAVRARESEQPERFEQHGAIDKGKVLSQVVMTGTPPLAPVIYARVAAGLWLFQRPDLEQNVLLIPDTAPAFVFEDFVTAVATVANASSADCLESGFMTVMRQSTYDAMPEEGKLLLRTKSVVYEPAPCPAGHSACAQFPLRQMVWLEPAGAGELVQRERFVTGRRIGIDSSRITKSTSMSRGIFVHELLHSLGIAHPKLESLGSGHDIAKLVVPGTLGGSCVAPPCAAGTNYPSIMHQAMDLGRTNSLQPDDVDVIATLYTSAGGCGYRSAARVIVPQ